MTARGHTTQVLTTATPETFASAVAEAARLLKAGELVALPTETVYGLAANALDPHAVARIYQAKGRPPHNPIIVHVAGLHLARQCTSRWTDLASRLAHAFWPGPLTLVLPKAPTIPDIVCAGGNTVGIRWPSHPFAQAVIRACGFPLAAPSANLSNQVSPTAAHHVLNDLQGHIPLVIDGGPCNVGIESTVLDLAHTPPRILRPGMIHEESLHAVTGPLSRHSSQASPALRSPGLLDLHYAPKAPLHVLSWIDDTDLQRQLAHLAPPSRSFNPSTDQTLHPIPPGCCVLTHTRIPSTPGFLRVSVIPHDPEAYARALYAELHRCDDAGASRIVVEALPATPAWQGLADRLRRAASR